MRIDIRCGHLTRSLATGKCQMQIGMSSRSGILQKKHGVIYEAYTVFIKSYHSKIDQKTNIIKHNLCEIKSRTKVSMMEIV